jgi:hypothetical protein
MVQGTLKTRSEKQPWTDNIWNASRSFLRSAEQEIGLSNAHSFRLWDRRRHRPRRAQWYGWEAETPRLHNINVFFAGFTLGVLGPNLRLESTDIAIA